MQASSRRWIDLKDLKLAHYLETTPETTETGVLELESSAPAEDFPFGLAKRTLTVSKFSMPLSGFRVPEIDAKPL